MKLSRASNRIIEELISQELLTIEQAQRLNTFDNLTKKDFEAVLGRDYNISQEALLIAKASYANVPILSLRGFTPEGECLKHLSETMMISEKVLPIGMTTDSLTVAFADPTDIGALQKVQDTTKKQIIVVAALSSEIEDLLEHSSSENLENLNIIMRAASDTTTSSGKKIQGTDVDISQSLNKAEEAPVIRIVNMILLEAMRRNASDIHFEPFDDQMRLRYRIGGVLYEGITPPKNLHNAITSRIKVMSHLDISERRVPQDGKFRIKAQGREIDLRVSTLPTVHGEKIVMRLLDKNNLKSGLDDLGLAPEALRKLKKAVSHPHGLILVTGPTGSGKTTTLYSCLQELNKPEVNITTVENPVEYQCHGINQVEINEKTGMTFSSALRSILRQDPDIVLVGETRDKETAEIAVKAALTGHLVMTTLHTNSAPGAIARLGDMGIEPFLLSSSLVLSQAQRLVRTICPYCKEPVGQLDPEIFKMHHIPREIFKGKEIFQGKGCTRCAGSGYKGRASIMEILVITPAIREMIILGESSDKIAAFAAQEQGYKNLLEAGLMRVLEGVTTLEEVVRVAASGD